MALCEQCGSIRISLAPPGAIDRIVTVFIGKRTFLLTRCGWKARRNCTDEELRKLEHYGVGGAEPDPDLVVLDGDLDDSGPYTPSRSRTLERRSNHLETDEFDLGMLRLDGAAEE